MLSTPSEPPAPPEQPTMYHGIFYPDPFGLHRPGPPGSFRAISQPGPPGPSDLFPAYSQPGPTGPPGPYPPNGQPGPSRQDASSPSQENPDSRKRPLSGPEASHVGVPHPSNRQPLGTIHNPISLEEVQDPIVLGQQPTYPITFSFQNVGPAPPPPMEAVVPPQPAYSRDALKAKIDKLTPAMVKSLLLNAAASHFTVADRVDLEFQKSLQREAERAARDAAKAAAKAREVVNFDHFFDESWDWLTKYTHVGWSAAYNRVVTVNKHLRRMFGTMADAAEAPGCPYETKVNALRNTAGIYLNIVENIPSEIAKIIRNDAHEYGVYMDRIFETFSDEEVVRMHRIMVRTPEVDEQSLLEWLAMVQKKVKGMCYGLDGSIQRVIDDINRLNPDNGEDLDDDDDGGGGGDLDGDDEEGA